MSMRKKAYFAVCALLKTLDYTILWIKHVLGIPPYQALVVDGSVELTEHFGYFGHFSGRRLYALGFGQGSMSRGFADWWERHVITQLPTSLAESKRWANGRKDAANWFFDPERTELSHEETIHLVRRGALHVRTTRWGAPVALDALWTIFDNGRFAVRFAVYSYYLEHGWTVRDGSNFGADFVLYRYGPGKGHSEFTVVILDSRNFEWKWLLARLRVAANAKKRLVLCYLEGFTKPTSVREALNARVIECIVDRWIPEKHRV